MSKPTPAPNDADHANPDARPRIILAGLGLVTPLGEGAWPTFRALLNGRTLSDRADALPADIEPVDLARSLGCVASAQHGASDPAVELAERASREAAGMAGVSLTGMGLWLGTSKGAVARLSWHLGSGRPIDEATARCVALGPHAYLADALCRRMHTRAGPHVVAACSSGLFALDAARLALLTQPPDAPREVLVASSDAAITPAFVHSYRRLGVLGEMTRDTYRQYPLDDRRLGFMLSELGAAVVLRRIEPGEPIPAGTVELVDTATACEPYDMVRSPEQMRGLAGLWSRVLSDGLAGRKIDLIHPHAPGTREHDPAELDVLLQTSGPAKSGVAGSGAVYPDVSPRCVAPPDVYAVKGAIGHGLGASGLVSVVVSALTLLSGKRPPMPWLTEPMTLPGGRRLETDAGAQVCDRNGSQAVLAAGFGGHLAAAVLLGHGKPTPVS